MITDPTLQPTEFVKAIMLEIVCAVVDQPEEVQLELIEDNGVTLLHLRVAPQDIGKVIGKQGRTARSLRTVLGAVSVKLHRRFALDIVEQE